ncbi:MAG: hypothetical protein H5T45_04245 [Thermoplasmatales archaeon]|nr:hypothetical protein [Thermoplasmatales archaeon]
MKLIALLVGAIIISSVSACYFVEASSLEEKISSFLPNSFFTLFYLLFPKIFDKLKVNESIENDSNDEIAEETNEARNNSTEENIDANEEIPIQEDENNSTEEINDDVNLTQNDESNEIENNSSGENEAENPTQDEEDVFNETTEEINDEINSQKENSEIEDFSNEEQIQDEEIINENEIENNSTEENEETSTEEGITDEINSQNNENAFNDGTNEQNEDNLTEANEEINESEQNQDEENITNEKVNDENNSAEENISRISEEINENQDEGIENISDETTEGLINESSKEEINLNQDEIIENNSSEGATEQNENISDEANEEQIQDEENIIEEISIDFENQTQEDENASESSEIENNSNEETSIPGEENFLEWAFLVYISGDNDLYEYAVNELNELLSINSSGIAILFDGALNNDSKLYILNNSITTIEKNELNMGSNSTLEEFILYAQEILRAKNYAIEFWGHGNGWAGTCLDKSSSDLLEIGEIKRALENKNISIIIFSSCNMGCIEVAYALRNCSQYMLASPAAMLATGLPHEKIFARGFGDVEEVCGVIYEEYMSYYSYASPKFAIWNLSMFDEFIGQFSLFIDYVKNLSFWNARNESAINSQYIDLYSFANKINFSLPQIFYGNASIYFPLPLYYSKYYSNTDFAKNTLWDEFLKSIK